MAFSNEHVYGLIPQVITDVQLNELRGTKLELALLLYVSDYYYCT